MGSLTEARTPSLPALAALVAAGAALGTLLRAGLGQAFPHGPGEWPWATFAINLVGSFVLAALLETLAHSGPDAGRRRGVRLGAGTGVIGGFTTYSTYVVEIDRLVQSGHGMLGAAYALLSVAAGLAAAGAGLGLAASAARRRRARSEATR
ncbi:MAG: CrcB family protein [Propioniciclava sp.]|uniref:FluC/FEX family fluoride channel n=1 Tax=Propioniciclava sp. TaxID=2038686 RepID=UPI0039E21591